MSSLIKIAGGEVYDPANNIDGEVRDIWIENGKIVAAPSDPEVRPARVIDATGLVVMPGGIDMHCHIAGPKVNMARKMRPEQKRSDQKIYRTANTHSGTMGSAPSTFATGYTYAGLGYTTAFDAAIPPLAARHVHEEFEDTPCLDKGFYVLLGNNHFAMESIKNGDSVRLRDFIAWLMSAAKAFAPKLVNPGGVEVWKQQQAGNVSGLDEPVDHFDVTPRQIISGVTRAGNELGLPHPVHIHCNNLGMPGNWQTTLETMKALDGHRGHLTHIQFHSYGGGDADENTFNSKVAPLVEYLNDHDNITIDVGQVMFGETTSMTGDGPLGYYLANLYGSKWYSGDTEMESGCGIAPIKYRNKSLVHGLQWGIGLDWYLMVKDPWRVVMSTDHPNGASFRAYPQIVRLLMDRTYRQDILKTCHPAVRERCSFPDIDREYTLGEIAVITRAGPARILGLTNKGHLGVGADADITIYTPHENKEIMFEMPRIVIKGGELVVEDTELRYAPEGRTLHVNPGYDVGREGEIGEWFEKFYSVRFRNYPVSRDYLHDPVEVDCRSDT
ncbi:MAG: formylmethanofuran dehydrogenase subunit A [Planctomycetota bacterium]|nr:MAG: formylmethanofuran dehydrogenase subunit A [Planctomycetota bacterium]REJ92674.1 MAG: formylmethanofuran dehydrogenase subunit A [Planctomycetota bacterium]REK23710.1 MAG: formylmethanofuran dehydrogenase subunit A [Planctomycetota bacterium]REK47564.1 MAG: formylmethanofuran dehydrogenase subunit A [Planctomycetota bacterium]